MSRLIVFNSVRRYGGLTPSPKVLVSKPYPLEVVEELKASIVARFFQLYMGNIDLINSNIGLISGDLQSVLSGINFRPESLETNLTIIDGTLRSVLIALTYLKEEIEAGLSLQAGTLEVKLVSTFYKNESIEANLSLVSGTLT